MNRENPCILMYQIHAVGFKAEAFVTGPQFFRFSKKSSVAGLKRSLHRKFLQELPGVIRLPMIIKASENFSRLGIGNTGGFYMITVFQ